MRRDAVEPQHRGKIGARVRHRAPLDPGMEPVPAAHRWRSRVPGQCGEIRVHEAPQLQRAKVARHDQRRGVRRVVRVEERADIRQRRGVQVIHRADDRVGVRKAGRAVVRPGNAVDEHRAIWLVVHAQPSFFLDRFPLVVKRLFADEQGAQPVRFQPEHDVEVVRRNGREVVGPVLRRRSVVLSARAFDQVRMHSLRRVRRPFEHEVFEEMGESGTAGPLVSRPHVVPQIHRHDRRGMIFGINDAQPVRKDETLVVDRSHLGRERAGSEQSSRHDQRRKSPAISNHGWDGTTGPLDASSKVNRPSFVSPFTTRRGVVRVTYRRNAPLRIGSTSN